MCNTNKIGNSHLTLMSMDKNSQDNRNHAPAENPYLQALGISEPSSKANSSEDAPTVAEQAVAEGTTRKLSRRTLLLGVCGAMVLTAGGGLLVARPWEVEDVVKQTAPASFEVTDEDKRTIIEFIEQFMKVATDFGVDGNKLTPDTIRNVRYLVKTKNNGYSAYMRSRSDAYKNTRQFIWEGSSLFYTAEEVSHWNKEAYLLDERMPTFKLQGSPTVSISPSGTYYIDNNGGSHRKVSARVDFVTKETVRVQESDGEGSNGAFAVMSKEIPATVNLELIESNSRWYLSSQTGSSRYLLSTWDEFNSSEYAESQNTGFVKEGEIIPTPLSERTQTTPSPSTSKEAGA